MFNSYVVLASHDKVSDTGRATTCRCKFKAPSLQTKSTKIEEPSENTVLNGKQFEDFRQKTETQFTTFQETPVGHQCNKTSNWIPSKQ